MTRQGKEQRGLAQITVVCDPVAKNQVGCAFCLPPSLLGSTPHNHTNRFGAQDLGHYFQGSLIHHHMAIAFVVVIKASNKKYLRAQSSSLSHDISPGKNDIGYWTSSPE